MPLPPSFEALIDEVQGCARCPRMCGSVRVLSWGNGSPLAPLMFVGEAPGRLGADRTAIPFHGDKSGDNFEHLIGLAQLSRADIFVTNAVLCNPRDDKGNNAPPSPLEVRECANHLRSQIDLVQPLMVMTLGAVALEATRHIEDHALTLRTGVRTASDWYGRRLLPLYHPGARAMIHRSFANQTADYYFVGETFRRLFRPQRQFAGARGVPDDWRLVRCVLQRAGAITPFRLHKLLYLIDERFQKDCGRRATSFFYVRQKDGPYCVELGSRWHSRFEPELIIRRTGGTVMYEMPTGDLFTTGHQALDDVALEGIVEDIVATTGRLSDAALKTRVYLTWPMREILKAEKAGQRMLNRPLLAA